MHIEQLEKKPDPYFKVEEGSYIINMKQENFHDQDHAVLTNEDYDEKYKNVLIPREYLFNSYEEYSKTTLPSKLVFWKHNEFIENRKKWNQEKSKKYQEYFKDRQKFFDDREVRRKKLVNDYRKFCVKLYTQGWKIISEEKKDLH